MFNYWLLIVSLLLIAGIVFQQAPLFLSSLLFFLAGGMARLWHRYCLSRVDYNRRLSPSHVFQGEEVRLEIEIANRKPLPLPWVEVDDEIPAEVTLLSGKTQPSYKSDRMLIRNLMSLNWYSKVKRYQTIKCSKRGYFAFGPARLSSGDLFGFFSRSINIDQPAYLTVYPRIVPLYKLGIPTEQLMGNIRMSGYLCPDPLVTQGVREYNSGDSMKNIHWKNSARLSRLQTKIFEPTAAMDIGIFLDVRTMKPPFWGYVPHLLELAIITAASIAKYAIDARYRVGLYVNQSSRMSKGFIRVPPGRNRDQLQNILEALAQVQPTESISIDRLVNSEGRNLPWGYSMVIITPVVTEPIISSLVRARKTGRNAVLVSVGASQTEPVNIDIPTYFVPDSAPWNELETLQIDRL